MKRCTVLRASNLRGFQQSRRWVSYDKSDLTKEAILKKVQGGLGHDLDGNLIKLDPDSKTVSTAVGDLPISPVMDPSWIKARRRQRKDAPTRPSGRFRRKLGNNPYALALISPMRWCYNTQVMLPRYFLQDFEVVEHPETKSPWWAPGPSGFEKVVPRPFSEAIGQEDEPELEPEEQEEGESDRPPKGSEQSTTDAKVEESPKPSPDGEDRYWRAPLTGYTLNRKRVIDAIGGNQRRKMLPQLIVRRTGTANTINIRNLVWRSDMGDVLLKMLRRRAVDGLIYRATRSNSPDWKFVEPCSSWDATKDVFLRGCVLWIPKEDQGARNQYATIDVEAKFGSKMAVHDLRWLLGEEEVKRLKESAEVYRDNEIIVLKQWRSESMIKLHQLLWRLQGYLADPKPNKSENDGEDVD